MPSECIHLESTLELFLKYMKSFITFKEQKTLQSSRDRDHALRMRTAFIGTHQSIRLKQVPLFFAALSALHYLWHQRLAQLLQNF